jgi:lipid-binding SYLF domain-containing protein
LRERLPSPGIPSPGGDIHQSGDYRMPNRVSFFSFLAALALTAGAAQVDAQAAREEGHLLMATQVLDELASTPDTFIPDRLLQRAYAIAVVPDVTKVAFIFGGRRGSGAMVVRDKNGHFSNPVFIALTGGSIGWQWGVEATDVVLVFTTQNGVEGITGGKVTLGADASVAAGPVGRQASVATDANFTAEVYSYSRNRGLFAGIALDGTVLSIDRGANALFYNKAGVTASEIISGEATTTDNSAQRFMAAITASTGTTAGNPAPVASAAPSAPAPAAAAGTAPPPSGAAQSFPMADPKPGADPK